MNFNVDFADSGRVATVSGQGRFPFRSGFALGSEPVPGALFAQTTSIQSDLIGIAIQIYVADRLCKRPSSGSAAYRQGWARNLALTFSVLEPDYWATADRNRELEELLCHLTGDQWSLNYSKRRSSPTDQGILDLGALDSSLRLCLFSGGLDSLAGLADVCRTEPDRNVMLVSACTGSRSGRSLDDLVQQGVPQRARQNWVRVKYNLQKLGTRGHHEATQRSRCLPPMVTAAILAAGVGADEVLVMENGVGAINLPYSSGQIGQNSTRSTHPYFLLQLSRWLSGHLEKQISLRLRFPFLTKGQMCRSLAISPWRELVAKSFSCDRFGRGDSLSHCGRCTSCLLRRQSLHAAGLVEADRADYETDVYSAEAGLLDEKGLVHVRSMSLQAHRIAEALSTSNAWESLSYEFPEIHSAALGLEISYSASSEQVRSCLLDLYRRYVAEWEAFQSSIRLGQGLWEPRAQCLA